MISRRRNLFPCLSLETGSSPVLFSQKQISGSPSAKIQPPLKYSMSLFLHAGPHRYWSTYLHVVPENDDYGYLWVVVLEWFLLPLHNTYEVFLHSEEKVTSFWEKKNKLSTYAKKYSLWPKAQHFELLSLPPDGRGLILRNLSFHSL